MCVIAVGHKKTKVCSPTRGSPVTPREDWELTEDRNVSLLVLKAVGFRTQAQRGTVSSEVGVLVSFLLFSQDRRGTPLFQAHLFLSN